MKKTTPPPHSPRKGDASGISELTDDEEEKEPKQEVKVEKSESSETDEKMITKQEIMKEVKEIKRQNTITHYLLTASILLTLAWQLSEFSLIIKIREGFNNPLKSIGGAFKQLFTRKSNKENNGNQDLAGILSHLDLPGFDTSNGDEDDD